MAILIPPKLSVVEIVGGLKGSSSRHIDQVILQGKHFSWQAGCGAVTISERRLQKVITLIQKQKQHHGGGMLWGNLEQLPPQQSPGDKSPG